MSEYKVTVPSTFKYAVRRRAGVAVPRDGGFIGELTADQVKAIKADPELTLTKVEAADPEKSTEPSLDWTRKELDAYATEHGVTDPAKLKDKQEVLDAITAAAPTE